MITLSTFRNDIQEVVVTKGKAQKSDKVVFMVFKNLGIEYGDPGLFQIGKEFDTIKEAEIFALESIGL